MQLNKEKLEWDKTPNFKHGLYNSLYSNLSYICGELVYGKKLSKEREAYKYVIKTLEWCAERDIFRYIPTGTIIKTNPTEEESVNKLVDICKRGIEYYSNVNYQLSEVTDNWYISACVKPGDPLTKSNGRHQMILKTSGKRFSSNNITVKEEIDNILENCTGILSEGWVISFLNSGLKCPECKKIGKIGWCDMVAKCNIDGFRDGICMNCYDNNVITLFEIKTRWENMIGNKGTYAGSYTALNTLMAMKANIYLVIASRDTGIVRIGKITSSKMKGNKKWLYALQENLNYGSPSSFVYCKYGLHKCPVNMPILTEVLTKEYIDKIIDKVKKILG
jgi:hypothetical protein